MKRLDMDITSGKPHFGLLWWSGRRGTMNWFTFGPMRVQDEMAGPIVGICLTINGHFFGACKDNWWNDDV